MPVWVTAALLILWAPGGFRITCYYYRRAYYKALVFIVLLAHDVWKALWFDGRFGVGVGTLVLLANVTTLSCYTFGCHSLRHLVGGFHDRLSGAPVRKRAYD